MTKQGLVDMIFIVCTRCGQHIEMDKNILPYKGEVACPNCRNVMKVFLCTGIADSRIETIGQPYPDSSSEIGKKIWSILNEVEKNSLEEAALSLGYGAYTASEFMSLRALESVCRRCYMKLKGGNIPDAPWAGILDDLAKEKLFEPYSKAFDYFRGVRNKLAHPEKVSTMLDAKSSYNMALRLIRDVVTAVKPSKI